MFRQFALRFVAPRKAHSCFNHHLSYNELGRFELTASHWHSHSVLRRQESSYLCLIKLGQCRRLKSGFALYRSAGPAVLQRRVWHHPFEPAPISAHAGCIAISHVHSKHIIALGRTSRCRVCPSLVRAAMRLSSRTSFQHLL